MCQDTYRGYTVITKQQRYEQTTKGKKARQRAIANYRGARVKWEVWLDEEMSEALQTSIPVGTSKTDYLMNIFQKHLDRVGCTIHTKEEP